LIFNNYEGSILTLDGAWAIEVMGLFGWDRTGIAFLDKGNILGGSSEFFHHGNYVTEGDDKVKIKLHFKSHGETVSVFGEKRKEFSAIIKATYQGDEIKGHATLVGARSDDVRYSCRLLRIGDLPTFPS
jgi:hypothetical protein